jgi:hypothetical protein
MPMRRELLVSRGWVQGARHPGMADLRRRAAHPRPYRSAGRTPALFARRCDRGARRVPPQLFGSTSRIVSGGGGPSLARLRQRVMCGLLELLAERRYFLLPGIPWRAEAHWASTISRNLPKSPDESYLPSRTFFKCGLTGMVEALKNQQQDPAVRELSFLVKGVTGETATLRTAALAACRPVAHLLRKSPGN